MAVLTYIGGLHDPRLGKPDPALRRQSLEALTRRFEDAAIETRYYTPRYMVVPCTTPFRREAIGLMNEALGVATPVLLEPAGPDWKALAAQYGSPLLVLDCDRVRMQHRKLSQALPRVRLHYAIKALPNETMVATLAEEGAAFDIATSGEIAMLKSCSSMRRRRSIPTPSSATRTSRMPYATGAPPS